MSLYPPHIGVAPSYGRSESHMPSASGYGGTTTAASLVNPLLRQQQQQQQTGNANTNHLSALSVNGYSTNPLLGAGGAKMNSATTHHHNHLQHAHFAPSATLGGTGSASASPVTPLPPTPMLGSTGNSVTFGPTTTMSNNTANTMNAAGDATQYGPNAAAASSSYRDPHVHFGGSKYMVDSVGAQHQHTAAASALQQQAQQQVALPTGQVRDALVQNLKKQVTCLEMECKFLKEKLQQSAASTSAAVVHHHSGFSPTKTDGLIKRANELEAEVLRLRNAFAEREQKHQVEIAMARADAEAAVFTAVANGKHAVDAVNAVRLVDAKEVEFLKENHAREVVTLQRRNEQLKLELTYQTGTNGSNTGAVANDGGETSSHSGHTRDAMASEIVQLKDACRNFENAVRTLTTQNEALQKDFTSNQSKLIAAESLSGELRRTIESQKSAEDRTKDDKATLEKELLAAKTSEAEKKCAMDQAKAEVEKLRFDLQAAIGEKVAAEANARKANEYRAAAEAELIAAKGVTKDITSQRDKVQSDFSTLLLKHTQLEVKEKQQGQVIDGQSHSLKVMERQYCDTLAELEAVKRHARAREEVYKECETPQTALLAKILVLKNECDALKEQLTATKSQNAILTTELEKLAKYADMENNQKKMEAALSAMGRAKEMMATVVRQQMDIADNILHVVDDIPCCKRTCEPLVGGKSSSAAADVTAVPLPPAPAPAPVFINCPYANSSNGAANTEGPNATSAPSPASSFHHYSPSDVLGGGGASSAPNKAAIDADINAAVMAAMARIDEKANDVLHNLKPTSRLRVAIEELLQKYDPATSPEAYFARVLPPQLGGDADNASEEQLQAALDNLRAIYNVNVNVSVSGGETASVSTMERNMASLRMRIENLLNAHEPNTNIEEYFNELFGGGVATEIGLRVALDRLKAKYTTPDDIARGLAASAVTSAIQNSNAQ